MRYHSSFQVLRKIVIVKAIYTFLFLYWFCKAFFRWPADKTLLLGSTCSGEKNIEMFDRSWMAKMFASKSSTRKKFIVNSLPIVTRTVSSLTICKVPDAVRTDLKLIFL